MKCEKYFPSTKETMDFGGITIYNDDMIIDTERLFTISSLRIVKVSNIVT